MAESSPAVLDTGAHNMSAFFRTYSNKLEGIAKKVADEVRDEAKANIERGFTSEGRFQELSRFTMVGKTRGRTSPLVATGALLESIESESLSADFAEVKVNAPYGAVHEFGKVMDIKPGTTAGERIRRFFLARFIESSGQTMPLRQGTMTIQIPERPFLRPAFETVVGNLEKILTKEFGPNAPGLQIRVQGG